MILLIILLALAVEAVTEILTSSDLTDPFRQIWKRYTYPIEGPPRTGRIQYVRVWIDKLITCGYCTSVWVAAIFAIWAPAVVTHDVVNWVCFVFVLHRLANWIHVIFELVKKGRVKTHDLEVSVKIKEDGDGSSGESVGERATEIESGSIEAGHRSDDE